MDHQLTHDSKGGFPLEIIHEILSRLPVKSLCRFKCVSKRWRALISDPKFVATHFYKGIEDKDLLYQRRRVIFTDASENCLHSMHLDEFLNHNHQYNLNTNHHVDTDDFDERNLVTTTELQYVYSQLSSISVPLLCSCNGLLLCMLGDWELYLVNPATRESKKLPKLRTYEHYSCNVYGFGFDYSTHKHKVINGLLYHDEGVVFNVYTLETNSWREIDDLFPYNIDPRGSGILLNGDLHWLGDSVEDESSLIVSLALTEDQEEVREIPLPPGYNSFQSCRGIKLGVFKEWLCVTHHDDHDYFGVGTTYNEFWVMMEHGVEESWTKMRVSIPYSDLSHSGFWTKVS